MLIILDLGGVLFPVDFSKTAAAFAKHSEDSEEVIAVKMRARSFLDKLNCLSKGSITPAEFKAFCIVQLNIFSMHQDAFWKDFCAMLGEPSTSALEAIKHFQAQGHRVVALTDMNPIHQASIERRLARLGCKLLGVFDGVYPPSELQSKKSDGSESFKKVLTLEGIDPADVVFVTDTLSHIEYACEAGIRAGYYSTQLPSPTLYGQELTLDGVISGLISPTGFSGPRHTFFSCGHEVGSSVHNQQSVPVSL